MSDTNQERLLTDLLREVAHADAQLTPSVDLESRVMARWDAGDAQIAMPAARPPYGARIIWASVGLAAAILLMIGASWPSVPSSSGTPAASIDSAGAKPPVVIAESTVPDRGLIAEEPSPRRISAKRRPAAGRAARPAGDVVDFMPLNPMAQVDLSGSFQIVPVRINNTPAHLLLGEDGVAQGILWRSR